MVLRIAGAVLGVLFVLWGLAPTLTGRLHAGCVTLIVVGVFLLLFCRFTPQVVLWVSHAWQSTVWRVLLITIASMASALVLLFLVVSGLMIGANANKPSDDATLIVLGAGLRDDRPGRILRGRLDATVAYLNEHEQAVCVVTGGQGRDELCTEAEAMRTYLLEKGIDANRIFMEDKATSTYENIAFSKEIIEQNNLSRNVAVVTQEFHQYRAQQFAKTAFDNVGGVTARTPIHLFGSYWIRDFAGICHMVLLGR